MVAISVSSCRVTSARPIESAPNPAPSRAATNVSIATPPGPPRNVAPTMSARPTMMADWITIVTEFISTRPQISAPRWTGEIRNRSTIPRSRSSMTGIPPHPAEKNAVIITTPGTRYSV